ncbi:hypothetical protein LBMAG48_27850 [Phycisphaerae bacterium]|jgi:hypothetical protein|nr:hypothetical protein LBMAG48_27850 [Phycisphaerae bacterium]
MKKILALLAVAGMSSAAMADNYGDAQNDLFNNGFSHLDITSVDVTHTASTITFEINVRGDMNPGTGGSNWGKYMIGIDTGAAGGASDNGWTRPINWTGGQGIDFWVGTWADNGGYGMGGELRSQPGGALLDATYTTGLLISGSTSNFKQTITLSRAALGLTGNDTFRFDVMSSGGGGGDPGVDHLSRSDLATSDWSVASDSGTLLSYTIPSPSVLALAGMGGLVAARRRRA